ncbi:MAG: hypothetical protein IKN53_04375 [Oscillibacter sp.]|nr:hypothetical protein [Oscillibacter sp.]
MLKRYRRRFVLFNVLTVGVVLLAALIAQGAYQYRIDRAETESTMRLVLEPYNAESDLPSSRETIPAESERAKPPSDAESEADGSGAKPSPPPDGAKAPPNGGVKPPFRQEKENGTEQNVVAVFYSEETDEISVISRKPFLDEEVIAAAVREVLEREEPFSTLAEQRLIYYKESHDSGCKIALADTAYLTSRTLRNALVLLAVYAATMALVLWISVELSKRAAKPMEDAIEMERQFIADISHDLKTPIAVVLANNSILKSNPEAPPQERQQWLESTDTAAKNMMEMVGEMLALSALESVGTRTVERTAVDLSSAAEKAALQLESLAYERGVTIETDLAPAVTVLATEEFAERICGGLIENAIKYEPAGGRVYVTLERKKKRAALSVRNPDGVIAAEELAHVFERFYRGDKARTEQGGHGLGLPIVKRLTDLLGAEISVESDAERGTVFTVTTDCAE